MALIGDVLEAAVTLCIKSDDMKAFERSVAQLRPVNASLGRVSQAGGASKQLMVGLYLIHLLVEARLAEFHAEVELLTPEERAVPFIAFPLTLETYLMEGSYNKVRGQTRTDTHAHRHSA